MLNTLEDSIQKIIAAATASTSAKIAAAVRELLAAEIVGSLPTGRAAKSTARAAPAPQAPKAKAGGRKPRGKRTAIAQADLDALLAVIAKKPGLGSAAIQAASGLEKSRAVRALAKLRETKAVKLTGEKRNATYSVG